MYSDERTGDLANELNIDYGSSSNSADQMRKIAESAGMDNSNSLYDVDKSEEMSNEEKTNNDINNQNDIKNNSGKVNKANSGREAFLNKTNNKNYYKDQDKVLKERLNNAKKFKAQNDIRNSDGSFSKKTLNDKRELKKNIKDAKQDIKNNRSNSRKARWFAATHPIEAQKLKLEARWKQTSIKTKIMIISSLFSLIFTMIFIVVLISPLITLGIIDIGGTSGGSISYPGYSDTSSNTGYWWPVGGSDISTNNGKSFAIGEPTCTYIYSNFGLRELDGKSDNHTGMDISCSPSNYHNIVAVLDGTVIEVVNGYSEGRNESAGYGNYVKIQHNNGDITIYGHMYINSITVNVGDQVKQGQVIGKMGNSGNSTGTHLHFEIRSNGSAVDPTNFISSDNARPSSSTGNFVSGESNQQTVCLSLKANGFSENGTVALLTNISYESSFDPTAVGDNGTSFGICQWHDSRYTNLQNSFPNNYQTIDSQIQFLIYELKNSYPSLYEDLINGNGDGNELTNKFCSQFEKPYDTENTCRNRGNNASSYDKYVKKGCQ